MADVARVYIRGLPGDVNPEAVANAAAAVNEIKAAALAEVAASADAAVAAALAQNPTLLPVIDIDDLPNPATYGGGMVLVDNDGTGVIAVAYDGEWCSFPNLEPINLPQFPTWVMQDDLGPALIHFDVIDDKYWFNGAAYGSFSALFTALTGVTITVPATSTRRNESGQRVQATANTLRLDHDVNGILVGILMEGAGGNAFLNSNAPVGQTIGPIANRTNVWMEGTGSLDLTGAYSGTVTAETPLYYDLPGNLVITPVGNVTFVQVEKNNIPRIPTSAVPTAGATVARAQETFRIGPNAQSVPFVGFNPTQGTMVVHGRAAKAFNTTDHTLVQLDDGTNNERIRIYRSVNGTAIAGEVRDNNTVQANPVAAMLGAQDFAAALAWSLNDCALSLDGNAEVPDSIATIPTVTRLQFNADGGWNGHLRKFAYFPRRVSALPSRNFYFRDNKRIHMLGDSFISQLFVTSLRALAAPRIVTADGVGGSTLGEQLLRWQKTPNMYGRILILSDDMALADTASTLALYAQIVALHDSPRFLIMEPGLPLGGVGGSSSRAERDAKWSAIVAAYPANVVPVTAAMQASSNGSALDIAYVNAGLWPGSVLGNPGTGPTTTIDGHLNAKGNDIYAQCAWTAIAARGW